MSQKYPILTKLFGSLTTFTVADYMVMYLYTQFSQCRVSNRNGPEGKNGD